MHKKNVRKKEILNLRKKTVKNSVRNVNTISKKKTINRSFNNSLNKINILNFYNDPYPHIDYWSSLWCCSRSCLFPF